MISSECTLQSWGHFLVLAAPPLQWHTHRGSPSGVSPGHLQLQSGGGRAGRNLLLFSPTAPFHWEENGSPDKGSDVL